MRGKHKSIDASVDFSRALWATFKSRRIKMEPEWRDCALASFHAISAAVELVGVLVVYVLSFVELVQSWLDSHGGTPPGGPLDPIALWLNAALMLSHAIRPTSLLLTAWGLWALFRLGDALFFRGVWGPFPTELFDAGLRLFRRRQKQREAERLAKEQPDRIIAPGPHNEGRLIWLTAQPKDLFSGQCVRHLGALFILEDSGRFHEEDRQWTRYVFRPIHEHDPVRGEIIDLSPVPSEHPETTR
jgi:hypothetical protein